MLRIVLPDPLGLLNVKACGLVLHLLPLPASRNGCGESWNTWSRTGLGTLPDDDEYIGFWVSTSTQVVLQLFGPAVFGGGDQVPHKAFDFVVPSVVHQAVGQQGPADTLHVSVC